MDIFTQFTDTIKLRMDNVLEEEKNNIIATAKLFNEAINAGKKIYFFGTGHSYIIGQEVFARAGGYAGFIPILQDELCMNHAFKSTLIERIDAYADVILNLYDFEKDDVIVMTSNSGRNALIIELAQALKEKGLKIVVLTSLEHSKTVTSRHKNGKKLYEYGDIVLDNKTDCGDACIDHGNDVKTGPTSTIMNCYIIHMVVSAMIQQQMDENKKPKVFKSSNIDHSDESNKELFDIYK
ncbi:MAG: SIS domain-containing protein [Erysipelotrichaceae bacterium]|nr:SIS domain-containing protein [Erysipelotrichaceae bacterium]MDY5252753.1 SIS domain-containing protein [Erysipelotrichaceae bacterium]